MWKVPCLPVMPWQMTLVSLLIHTWRHWISILDFMSHDILDGRYSFLRITMLLRAIQSLNSTRIGQIRRQVKITLYTFVNLAAVLPALGSFGVARITNLILESSRYTMGISPKFTATENTNMSYEFPMNSPAIFQLRLTSRYLGG